MHVHILGICGTFMGSLALLAKAMGYRVTGSDQNIYPPMSEQLDRLEIEVFEGYSSSQLSPKPDLVMVGNAMSRGNECVEYILEMKIPFISGPQWINENLLRHKIVFAVSGTHGKTSTASMLVHILIEAGYNPGFLIGGIPKNIGVSARFADSEYFVIEADEYDTAFFDKRSKFIHYNPSVVMINNLEFDHADIFDSLRDIKKQFHHLLRILPNNGHVIINNSDDNVKDVIDEGCWSNKVFYGASDDLTWQYILKNSDGSEFNLLDRRDSKNVKEIEVTWSCLGEHNVQNAVAASSAASLIGIELETISRALAGFQGVKRRMEILASHEDYVIYDDFAHHPTEILKTLSSLREKIGNDQIIALIEPRSRTMQSGLHDKEMAKALSPADSVIWYEGQDVKRSMSAELKKAKAEVYFAANISEIIQITRQIKTAKSNIVIMSNGDFSGLRELIKKELD